MTQRNKMQTEVFITKNELVELVNMILTDGEFEVAVSMSIDDEYAILSIIDIELMESAYDIQFSTNENIIIRRKQSPRSIRRDDRIGFVSLHPCRYYIDENELVSAEFRADVSSVEKKFNRVLKKHLDRISTKGVVGVNEKYSGEHKYESFYWTDCALSTGLVWKQTHGSHVYFIPQ